MHTKTDIFVCPGMDIFVLSVWDSVTLELFDFVESEFEFTVFYVTCNDISVIYVTAHRCAGGPKK